MTEYLFRVILIMLITVSVWIIAWIYELRYNNGNGILIVAIDILLSSLAITGLTLLDVIT